MSSIDTQQIWRALGSFYLNMFPEEERIVWETFWEAWSDITADMWGYAQQVDTAKSLYSTTATFERREVLVKLSNLVQDPFGTFRISSILQDPGGRFILRGFVPRDLRSFKSGILPSKGSIRIGVDVLDYDQVNSVTIEEGVYAGFVREATFVLASAPPHDYSDTPDFNENFDPDNAQLKMRVDHFGGEDFVDAVLVNPIDNVIVNPTGRLVLGSPNVNQEVVEYSSVSILGDRFLFTLAPTLQPPATSPQTLTFAHLVDETLVVHRHDLVKWSQTVSGWGRILSQGSALMVIDNDDLLATPQPPSEATLIGSVELRDNVDFDISVTLEVQDWTTILGTPTARKRRALTRLRIGARRLVIGIETDRTGAGVVTERLIWGDEGSEVVSTFPVTTPLRIETRFKRVGAEIELLFRNIDTEPDFTRLAKILVNGARATMDLVTSDTGTEGALRVSFDEVVRRVGDVAGSFRLEEFFTATSRFPFLYDIDSNLASAPQGLRDRPRLRSEQLTTIEDVNDLLDQSIRAVGGIDFEPLGVPSAGELVVGSTISPYESVTRTGNVFEFQLRNKLDPDVVPLEAGALVKAETRQLNEDEDFIFQRPSQLRTRILPTRDRMWAPVAQDDVLHIQNHYGVLTNLGAELSTETYLRRVQGVWSALMTGPSISNVESGVFLTMGLPVAQIEGTVTSIVEERDVLGKLTRRFVVITGDNEIIEHDLRVDIPLIVFNVSVGQAVERFQPLTTGVEVTDVIRDPLWHQRFVGVNEFERWNSFGVFVALEALNVDASVNDAVRFALRVKPSWTKLVIRFLLTSGNEDLSQDLDDDTFAIGLPVTCEDMSFDEGEPPADPSEILRLGEGHKLGQGKQLGGSGLWNFQTLSEFVVKHIGTCDLTAGAVINDGVGNLIPGVINVTTAAPHTAAASDAILISGAANPGDNGLYVINEVISATELQVNAVFLGADVGIDCEVRDYISLGEGLELGIISAFRCFIGRDQNLPTEVLDVKQIVNMAMVP